MKYIGPINNPKTVMSVTEYAVNVENKFWPSALGAAILCSASACFPINTLEFIMDERTTFVSMENAIAHR
jgi:hypothetical protein